MPNTQAYTVDWTVTIAPEGDVTEDVSSITIELHGDKPDQATVSLDTSKRPHALEEQQPIHVEVTDLNDTVEFDGFTDKVSDSDDEATVTVDAREPKARLDDTNVVGTVSADTLLGCVDQLIDEGPSQIRSINFDLEAAKSGYTQLAGTPFESPGTASTPSEWLPQPDFNVFAEQTFFGEMGVVDYPPADVDYDDFTQADVISGDRGKTAELQVAAYRNTTDTTFTLNITGSDVNGDPIQSSLNLPPGNNAMDAFGTNTIKLATTGGTGRWASIDSITSDVVVSNPENMFAMHGDFYNYVETNFEYSASDETTVREALDEIVSYIESVDGGTAWETVVFPQPDQEQSELVVRPQREDTPSTHTFIEGQNVMRPVADRDIDGVKNYVKVSGQGGVNVWAWAYNGSFYLAWSRDDIHELGWYPDDTSQQFLWEWKDSPANGHNDIDEIDLRAIGIDDNNIKDWYQALDVAKATLNNRYRQSVSGSAPVSGIYDAVPGDKAEIFYPSRGIPAKVSDNTFTVEQVSIEVDPQEAKTTVDFGTSRPSAEEIISRMVQEYAPDSFDPVPGTVVEVYEDGTAKVEADNGQVYDRMEII